MFKKPEDISPLPTGMMDAFNKTLNSQLGNYNQPEPVAETPAEEPAPAPEQQVEESVDTEAVNRVITGQDETLEASAEDQNEVIEGGAETVCEDNTNDKSDDGEGLDKVQPKAVKKKFKDRKDKDIDNDGDVDDSDKYLHKRRKAISKALAKEEAEELDEAKFDDNDFVHIAKANVTSFYNPKTDKIIGFSKAPKNPNRAPKPKKGANAVMRIGDAKKKKYNFTLPVNRRNFGEESGDLGKPEGFFSEEMDPRDHVRFNKETNMFCVYDKDGKKVYESEKEEEANQYAIDNHDALMGRAELADAKSSSGYDLYHRDFSGAMQHAYAFAKKKGFIVDKDEIDSKVAMGPKRPSSGKTNKYILGTNKKKNVHIQVANLDNKRYELNMYIESVDLEEKLKFKTTKKIKGKVYGRISGPFPKTKAEVIAGRDFRGSSPEVVKDGSGYSIFVPVKESLGPEDESKVKEIIGKLKGASKAHAGQAKDLEKAVNEEAKIKEGNAFTKALAAARLNGDDEFIVSGKKYKVEDFNAELEEGFSNFSVPIPKQTLNGKKIGGGKTPIVVKARSTREAISKAAKQLGVDFKFLKTGKVVKEAIDPADVDQYVATKGDKESAKMNIIVQLRKAADVKGNLDIVFADGRKQKIPANIIKIALDKYNSFRKPATKKKLIDGMTKSYRSMLQTLKTIKEYSEESESKES